MSGDEKYIYNVGNAVDYQTSHIMSPCEALTVGGTSVAVVSGGAAFIEEGEAAPAMVDKFMGTFGAATAVAGALACQ